MSLNALRPWGSVEWLMRHPPFKDISWFVIGNISPQDRSVALFRHSGASFALTGSACFGIVDGPSAYDDECKKKRDANRLLWEQLVSTVPNEFHEAGLTEPIIPVKRLIRQWTQSGIAKNVILDVSSMPERYFFPIMRWLLESEEVENLVVTYMLPAKYAVRDLAYNPSDWAQLPTFVGEEEDGEAGSSVERVIVGVGFIPFSLPEWLKKTNIDLNKPAISLLFPFPSAPANVRRSWEFVREVEASLPLSDESIVRIAANDLSGCFDRIQLLTKFGAAKTVFAPYGPKPHSVAICLHAINTRSEVFYTQPAYHHPNYSIGIQVENGLPVGFAYSIRLQKRELYR